MVRRIIHWAFFSTAMLDCNGPELAPDPQQRPQTQLSYRGDAPSNAPSVAAAPGRLRNTPVLVCDGVPSQERTACPLDDRRVTQIEDDDDGVVLHVLGAEREVENRVQCYRGLASVGLVKRTSCVLDIEDVDVSVRTEGSSVVVDLTRDEEDEVASLRASVRARLPEALVR